MGLVEQEWMSTLSTVDPDDVTYIDFVQVGNDLVKELKEEVNCKLSLLLP